MSSPESPALAFIRSYLEALESGMLGDELARFFNPDAEQVELPNKLNPNGGRSDLQTLLKRAQQGQGLLQSQKYEVQSFVEQEGRVAVEAKWSAVLAVPLGPLPAGHSMRAHFAMFFEFRNGRISAQRNYDCFEPW